MAVAHRHLRRVADALVDPINGASLAAFRIMFGLLMAWEIWRYFANDWIQRYYITPGFHFTYYGFGWVRPGPADLMYLHFWALGLLSVLIAAGLFYRVATILFFLGFTYVFLLEQARYLNHFYLVVLIALVMSCVPAIRMPARVSKRSMRSPA